MLLEVKKEKEEREREREGIKQFTIADILFFIRTKAKDDLDFCN